MAVGSRRHYEIMEIAPRHFFQTAEEAGVGEEAVSEIIDELRDHASAAVDSVVSDLPQGFPERLANSIQRGFKQRRLRASDA